MILVLAILASVKQFDSGPLHSTPFTVHLALIFNCSYTVIVPTWTEKKRRSNIKDHGIDFAGCEAIFDWPVTVFEDDRERYGEQRLCALGWLNGVVVHLT